MGNERKMGFQLIWKCWHKWQWLKQLWTHCCWLLLGGTGRRFCQKRKNTSQTKFLTTKSERRENIFRKKLENFKESLWLGCSMIVRDWHLINVDLQVCWEETARLKTLCLDRSHVHSGYRSLAGLHWRASDCWSQTWTKTDKGLKHWITQQWVKNYPQVCVCVVKLSDIAIITQQHSLTWH